MVASIAPCRHCGRQYRKRVNGISPSAEWLGTQESWEDCCNEQQDFCPCRSRQIQIVKPPKPKQLNLFGD